MAVYKIFSVDNQKYLYDRSTNNIVPISLGGSILLEKKFGTCFPDNEELGLSDKDREIAENEMDYMIQNGFLKEDKFFVRDLSVSPETFSTSMLTLEVTNRCNLKCAYCVYTADEFNEFRNHGKGMMSRETAKMAIDFYLEACDRKSGPLVSFFGGEPLLNFDLVSYCVDYIKNELSVKNPKFVIDTNGTCFSDKIVDFIIENEIFVQISIDGPKELHDRFRVFPGGQGTFSTIAQFLEALTKRDPNFINKFLAISCTICPPGDLIDLEKFFSSNYDGAYMGSTYVFPPEGVSIVDLLNLNSEENFTATGGREFRTKFIDTIKKHEELNISEFMYGFYSKSIQRVANRSPVPLSEEGFYPNGICLPGQTRLFVDADGGFSPCEKAGSNLCIGNVKDGLDFPKAQKMIDDYSQTIEPMCVDCWASRLCSMCFVSANSAGEFCLDKKQKACEGIKNAILAGLEGFTTMQAGPTHLNFAQIHDLGCFQAFGFSGPIHHFFFETENSIFCSLRVCFSTSSTYWAASFINIV